MAVKVKIKVRGLHKNYGSLHVLKGLDLDVYEGETLVILGRSGVGKSVLLKQLIGIQDPDAGTIIVDGLDILKLSRIEKRRLYRSMGMLFQGAALFDSMDVKANTGFYLTENPEPHTEEHLSAAAIKKRVDEALEMVDLSGTQEKMPSDLSGGMRKRAGLARLIAYRPDILLYDEPTTGLDPITAMQINKLIAKTQKELKSTSIVVTHDLRSAMEVGDRLALHHDGKIIHIAERDKFFDIDDPVIQTFIQNAALSRHPRGNKC